MFALRPAKIGTADMKARLTTLVNTPLAPGQDRPPRGMTVSSATVAPARDTLIRPTQSVSKTGKSRNPGIEDLRCQAFEIRIPSVGLLVGSRPADEGHPKKGGWRSRRIK